MFEVFFYTTAAITVLLHTVCQWYFSKGELKLAYPLTMAVTLCYIVMDVGMVLYDPVLAGVLLFTVANMWTMYMAYKGLRRLKILENNNDKQQ